MKVAIIPARGGSKRIPRKNIKLFAGKPMLSYAVSTAQESNIFDAIAVSSEDAEILALAEDLGLMLLKRPDELADDYTPTVPVITHAIKEFENWGYDLDFVCCIYPAVPFLQPQDLEQGLFMLTQQQVDYVFPVVAFASPVQRALRLATDGKVSPFFSGYESTRTQDLDPAYYDAGQFYWGKRSAWVDGKNIHTHGHALVIPEWRGIDIDTLDDWTRAELIKETLTIKKDNP